MTGASVRRVLARSCFAAAALAAVGAFIPSGAGAQTAAARPKIFSTAGRAIGVDDQPDQEGGLTPIKDTFHMAFVTGFSTMSSSNGPTAKATLADPGNGATQGPANACPVAPGAAQGIPQGFIDAGAGFIGNPLLQAMIAATKELQPLLDACTNAKWPFVTSADNFTPESRTVGAAQFGQPDGMLYGDGGGAHAVVTKDGTSSTDSSMGALRIAPVPGGGDTGLPLPTSFPTLPGQTPGGAVDTGLFSSGSIQSLTSNFFDGSTAVTHVESRLNGVKIIGGLITIDSITSIAEARYSNGTSPVGASSTTVQGVKFLGQDATIDDTGLHTANPSDQAQLTQVLNQAGLTIKLVGATQGYDEKGFMTAQSQGVVIEYSHPVDTGLTLPPPPQNPILNTTSPTVNGVYFVHYNLASVSARALARDLTIGGSSGTGGLSSPSFSTSTPTGGAAPSGFTGGTVSAPAPPVTTPSEAVAGTTTAFLGFDAGKVKLLYLAFTLATLGVCLVPRLALPARLPGPKA